MRAGNRFTNRDPLPPGAGGLASAAPEPRPGLLEAVVVNEVGAEVRVPLRIAVGRPISTHLRQARDDQGYVALRLAYRGEPLGEARIELPPRPRGETVWVWLELENPSRLRVELEHEERRATCSFVLGRRGWSSRAATDGRAG